MSGNTAFFLPKNGLPSWTCKTLPSSLGQMSCPLHFAKLKSSILFSTATTSWNAAVFLLSDSDSSAFSVSDAPSGTNFILDYSSGRAVCLCFMLVSSAAAVFRDLDSSSLPAKSGNNFEAASNSSLFHSNWNSKFHWTRIWFVHTFMTFDLHSSHGVVDYFRCFYLGCIISLRILKSGWRRNEQAYSSSSKVCEGERVLDVQGWLVRLYWSEDRYLCYRNSCASMPAQHASSARQRSLPAKHSICYIAGIMPDNRYTKQRYNSDALLYLRYRYLSIHIVVGVQHYEFSILKSASAPPCAPKSSHSVDSSLYVASQGFKFSIFETLRSQLLR